MLATLIHPIARMLNITTSGKKIYKEGIWSKPFSDFQKDSSQLKRMGQMQIRSIRPEHQPVQANPAKNSSGN